MCDVVKIENETFIVKYNGFFIQLIQILIKGNQYVVLDIERYKELRANELDLAYLKSLQDIQNGNFKVQTASEHIDELRNEL